MLACALRVAARRAVLTFGGPDRVLFVGESEVTCALARKISTHPEYGLEAVGAVSGDAVGDLPDGLPHLGRLADLDLRDLVVAHGVERVIVTAEDLPDEAMIDLVRNCGAVSVKVSLLPDHIDAIGPSVEVDDIEGLTVLGLNPLVLSRSSRFLKRLLDIVGATVGLLLAGPLVAALAIAIKLDSPGPVLFRQQRIGRGGKAFTVLKFRTHGGRRRGADAGAARRRAAIRTG